MQWFLFVVLCDPWRDLWQPVRQPCQPAMWGKKTKKTKQTWVWQSDKWKKNFSANIQVLLLLTQRSVLNRFPHPDTANIVCILHAKTTYYASNTLIWKCHMVLQYDEEYDGSIVLHCSITLKDLIGQHTFFCVRNHSIYHRAHYIYLAFAKWGSPGQWATCDPGSFPRSTILTGRVYFYGPPRVSHKIPLCI